MPRRAMQARAWSTASPGLERDERGGRERLRALDAQLEIVGLAGALRDGSHHNYAAVVRVAPCERGGAPTDPADVVATLTPMQTAEPHTQSMPPSVRRIQPSTGLIGIDLKELWRYRE